jgi:hypothetical protein
MEGKEEMEFKLKKILERLNACSGFENLKLVEMKTNPQIGNMVFYGILHGSAGFTQFCTLEEVYAFLQGVFYGRLLVNDQICKVLEPTIQTK